MNWTFFLGEMQSWVNAFWTGLLLLGLGSVMVLVAFIAARSTDSAFVDRSTIGGYNGAIGIAAMVVGLALTVVSAVVVLLS